MEKWVVLVITIVNHARNNEQRRAEDMSALAGIRVLELAESPSGEFCGKLLADFGADVIKLERPAEGSPTRSLGPFAAIVPSGVERSGLFAFLNTNKRSLVLDLTAQAGLDSLNALLKQVDVVIDDHALEWLKHVGLDPEVIEANYPNLIACSVTNFGLSPADDRQHAEDLNVFHSSGWGYHSPTNADPRLPPLKGPGRFQPSYEAGLEAALCIAAAMFERSESGLGRFIEVSKQEVLTSRIDYVMAQMIAGDMDASTDRAAFDLSGPAGIFACRDGHVYIWLSAPAHWEGLRQLLDDSQWMDDFPEHWMERGCTPERVATCKKHLAEWLKTQNKHEVAARAQKLGVTLVSVNNASDLIESPQYQFRNYFTTLEHSVIRQAIYPTVPYKLSVTPAKLETSAPLLGQHTDECLRELANKKIDTVVTQAIDKTKRSTDSTTKSNEKKTGPLAGIRVVELTKVWAGPYVGKLLAYLGAEVIRIESEDSLDVTRTYGVSDINNAPGFKAVNPQKLGIQVNMKTEKGVELILDLIAKSDIFVENLRPGAIDRLGLGYERVKAANPNIIYTSMGMFGNEGPLSYQTGYAPCFAALGGLTSLVGYSGESPAGINQRYSDSTFGAAAAYASLVALLYRQRQDVGQFIDVSAVECMSSMIGDAIMDFSLNGHIQRCNGNRHADMSPHGIYPCREGDWLCIAVRNDKQWSALANAMNRPELSDDARFRTLYARKANEDQLDSLVAQWTAGQDAVELGVALQQLGIAATKSQNSLDMIADHHLWSRDFYHEVTESDGSTRPILGPGWKMSRGAEITRGAPRLGEHNAYVFGDVLGLSKEQQAELTAAGVTK